MFIALSIALPLLAYLLGSIATAVWVSRGLYGVDIREKGSNNAGSTNMFRVLGRKAGIITQVVDVAKGSLAAVLPWILWWIWPEERHFMSDWSMELQSLCCGLAAVIGHVFPVFAGFRGGKGINTLLGMMLVTNPLAVLICLLTWVVVLYLSRYVSVASMLAVLTYPVYLLVLPLIKGTAPDPIHIYLGLGMFLLVCFTHRANIGRLLKGTESKSSWLRKG